ncbi:MAG: hypothetical protein AB8G86_29325 [Saprospiraceae bacterium]
MSVQTIPIKFSIEQVLSLTRQLPQELKLQLIKEWIAELEKPSKKKQVLDLDIEGFDTPFDLDKAKLTEQKLTPIQKLWADELPAEKLIKML